MAPLILFYISLSFNSFQVHWVNSVVLWWIANEKIAIDIKSWLYWPPSCLHHEITTQENTGLPDPHRRPDTTNYNIIIATNTTNRTRHRFQFYSHTIVLLPPYSHLIKKAKYHGHEQFALSTSKLRDLLANFQTRIPRRQTSILHYFTPTK